MFYNIITFYNEKIDLYFTRNLVYGETGNKLSLFKDNRYIKTLKSLLSFQWPIKSRIWKQHKHRRIFARYFPEASAETSAETLDQTTSEGARLKKVSLTRSGIIETARLALKKDEFSPISFNNAIINVPL